MTINVSTYQLTEYRLETAKLTAEETQALQVLKQALVNLPKSLSISVAEGSVITFWKRENDKCYQASQPFSYRETTDE